METNTSCLHHLFQQQAARTPDAIAVVDGCTTMTYKELDQRTDSLAGYLHSQGVVPDSIVGIFMDKCDEYIVAYIAILKAGGAYMPLELSYPNTFLEEILNEAKPMVIITKGRYADKLEGSHAAIILKIDKDTAYYNFPYDQSVGDATYLDNLAFAIYSSGTTGEPKGILMPHRSAVHSYLCRYEFCSYQLGDRVACNVFFVWELMRPLLKGASVYTIPDDIIYDPLPLLNFLEGHRITEILFTPSLLETVINMTDAQLLRTKLATLKTIWLNGEVVTTKLKNRLLEILPDHIRLLNTYSTSESHDAFNDDLRLAEDLPSGICPVGYPIRDVEIKLLDEQMDPASTEGELYIGGPCLARGYLNKPDLTGEHFVMIEGRRFYKTGDLAVLHPDGKLEITGRCDYMVKMRGYSVHLGTIETALLEHADVKSCVVIAEGNEGEDKRLIAYVVKQECASWKIYKSTGACVAIRNIIKPFLAHFMIPNVFVEMENIPLHPSTGKLNRKDLPPPPHKWEYDVHNFQLGHNPSLNKQEEVMSTIWEHVLLLEPGSINRNSNFFDFGGHSLLAVKMAVITEKIFGERPMVKHIYEHPTVSEFVQHINHENTDIAQTISIQEDAVLDPAVIPVSAAIPLSLRNAKSIFLTGATGFLGAFLLNELLESTDDFVRIYSLVRTRNGDTTEGLKRITDNLKHYRLWTPEKEKRIVPVIGDLAKEYLGLSVEQFHEQAQNIDIIFHCAALVNYVFSYSVLKPSMVTGTHEILRLACATKTKPLHYISTNGIFPGNDEAPYLENDQIDDYADRLTGGYGQAKWCAEKLVWKSVARGLPVCLYRPGNIGHHSTTGAVNPNDFQYMIIDACRKINCAPDKHEWVFEMTPIDFLVKAIVSFAGNSIHYGKVYNVVQSNPSLARFVFDLLAENKYISEYVSLDQWKNKLLQKAETDEDSIYHVLVQSLEDIEMYLLDNSVYDCTHFNKAVSTYGLKRPATDTEYFTKMIIS